MRERGFVVCVAKAVSMASPFYVLRTFQWLRRFNGCAVSMAAPFLAALFQWLRRFSLRCFNGFAVSRFAVSRFAVSRYAVSRYAVSRYAVSRYAVSMASPFLAALFLWLRRSMCFARFNGFAVSMATPFLAALFLASLFNFVEGFAVQWLRRLNACGV